MVCVAAVVLLLRVAGIPAWDGTYAEDNGVFFVDGLTRPWHLFVPYSGYLELGPRLIGQFIASFLPIVDASAAYAITGAVIGAAAGLFLYHASEGYIRSPWARALLGGALVLLPIAPLDIIDSGVDSPWYAMAALFFAVLWRPRSWPGMLAAALVAGYASSSEIVAIIYAPLLLIRLIALPRVREHAVTAGWLLGLVAPGAGRHAQLHHAQAAARRAGDARPGGRVLLPQRHIARPRVAPVGLAEVGRRLQRRHRHRRRAPRPGHRLGRRHGRPARSGCSP